MFGKKNIIFYRICITIFLLLLLNIVEINGYIKVILYIFTYLVIGYDILRKAIKGIINRDVLNEDFLMVIATIGTFFLAIFYATDEYNEAVAVMLLYQIGELFQSYAVDKSRRNIGELMDIRPDYANLKREDDIVSVDPYDVEVGDIVVLKPGEKAALDGTVISGVSTLDLSSLTGESVPVDVREGDEILSGSVNLNGILEVRVTKIFDESTASKILELVENAGSLKSKSEKFITKFARIYTPIVCYLALALALIPPIIEIFIIGNAHWGKWIYRALTFLVISCPCALVISIPLSFFAAIGASSKLGILIKGSNFLEILSRVDTIIFDKTGTLTKGTFEVVDINVKNGTKEELLEYAAIAESQSNHPVSVAIRNVYGKNIDTKRLSSFEEISGNGIVAKIDDKDILIGNARLMDKFDIDYEVNRLVGTVLYIALDNKYIGSIVLKDTVKKETIESIVKLQKIGIKNIMMLTGDKEDVAKELADSIGVTEYYSNLLPGDKVDIVREKFLSKRSSNSFMAFVGDGINDAPVLRMSDVGIAMGAIGSDAAIEAADVVLMNDNLFQITDSISIAKKCLRIVKQNIIFAIGFKVICLILGALGFANMWLAIIADVGVLCLAILNAVRLLIKK